MAGHGSPPPPDRAGHPKRKVDSSLSDWQSFWRAEEEWAAENHDPRDPDDPNHWPGHHWAEDR